MIRCEGAALAEALGALSLPAGTLVFVSNPEISDEWDAVAAELMMAFDLSQASAKESGPVVYVVDSDDLLGRRGTGRAMVACGLLSAARTLAMETARSGIPANTVALSADTPPEVVAFWVEALCRSNGPTGELLRLGVGHLGKALP
jgi:hypothetical protein